MQGLAGKVAIVTGASRGIGLGIAQRLVDEGARVCLTARKPEALDAAVETLGGADHAIAVAGKADDPEHREDTVRRTIETFGSLDLLVNNGIAMYGASKAMLISLTESLAVELGPAVRVNAVAPAIVKTQFAGPLFEGREDEVAASYPLKRLGVPEDVAGAVAYLLSDDASWVTGQTITLDGGVTLTGGL